MKDGSPQLSPVWANFENDHILVNTAEGRIKHKNILRDPRVAVSVVSHKNPLDMTTIRGRVVEIIPDYQYKHADRLTKQYVITSYSIHYTKLYDKGQIQQERSSKKFH